MDGQVIESDGKTENAQRTLALDAFTLAVLVVQVEMLGQERAEFGPDYPDHGCCAAGRTASLRIPTRTALSPARRDAGLPRINPCDVRHSYATVGRDAKIDWKALSTRIGHSDVAFTMRQYIETGLEADRQVANTLAALNLAAYLPQSAAHGHAAPRTTAHPPANVRHPCPDVAAGQGRLKWG